MAETLEGDGGAGNAAARAAPVRLMAVTAASRINFFHIDKTPLSAQPRSQGGHAGRQQVRIMDELAQKQGYTNGDDQHLDDRRY